MFILNKINLFTSQTSFKIVIRTVGWPLLPWRISRIHSYYKHTSWISLKTAVNGSCVLNIHHLLAPPFDYPVSSPSATRFHSLQPVWHFIHQQSQHSLISRSVTLLNINILYISWYQHSLISRYQDMLQFLISTFSIFILHALGYQNLPCSRISPSSMLQDINIIYFQDINIIYISRYQLSPLSRISLLSMFLQVNILNPSRFSKLVELGHL